MITTNDAPPTVIAICGSERSGGNTDLLLEYATRRFAQHSIVMTTIHLRDEGVSGPCTVPPRLRKAFTRPVFLGCSFSFANTLPGDTRMCPSPPSAISWRRGAVAVGSAPASSRS